MYSVFGADGVNLNQQEKEVLKIAVELPIILSSFVALVAAYNDAKSMLIPNWLTLTTIAAGLIFALWTGEYENLTGALLVFVVMLYFWSRGWIGGGDAKLAPGLALFLGAIPVLFGIALASAVFALWNATKAWRNSGRFVTFLMVLLGKVPGGAVPLAVLMGPMAVGFKLLGV